MREKISAAFKVEENSNTEFKSVIRDMFQPPILPREAADRDIESVMKKYRLALKKALQDSK